jgi:hypothetical protein
MERCCFILGGACEGFRKADTELSEDKAKRIVATRDRFLLWYAMVEVSSSLKVAK